MHRSTRVLAVVSAMVLGSIASQAITFGSVKINGVASSDWGLIGTNGIYVQVPGGILLGPGPKVITVDYNVTATAGNALTSIGIQPNGLTANDGKVEITVNHSGSSGFAYSQSSVGIAPLAAAGAGLAPAVTSSTVSTTITLSGKNAQSVAKMSVFNAFYEEKAVPEPASIIALAGGIALGLVRRKSGVNS